MRNPIGQQMGKVRDEGSLRLGGGGGDCKQFLLGKWSKLCYLLGVSPDRGGGLLKKPWVS